MDIKTVRLARKFNIGNYESLEVGFEASTTEQEGADSKGVLRILHDLERLAELYLQDRTSKPEAKVEKQENPILKFPEELRDHLSFEVKSGKIFCEFVERSVWVRINEAAKALGYEWVSAAKDSHWRVKK